LSHFPSGAHPAHILFQLRIVDTADDVGQWASTVAGDQVEQLGDGRRKAPDHEISVEKDCSDLRALKQVAKVAVGPVEFVDLRAELIIDCLQLLVDRLQFLFRGLELLIGGLQLLIDREQFFIGRAKLLVRRLELLDCRLQPFFGLLKLRLDLPDSSVVGLLSPCRLFRRSDRSPVEEHNAVDGLVVFADRLDSEADRLGAAIDIYGDAIAHDPLAGFLRAMERGAQIGAQAGAGHRDDITIGRSGGSLEVFPCPRREIECLACFVDDHVAR
jgi:hypothetical protein